MKKNIGSKILIILLLNIIVSIFLIGCSNPEDNSEKNNEVLALINGTLIDGSGLEPIFNATIIIRDEYIEEIGQSSDIEVPDGANIIDISGKVMLPGFFNTHVHSNFSDNNLKTWAKAGVTTVRDLGYLGNNSLEQVFTARNDLNTDLTNAHLVASGPLVTTVGGYGSFEVTSPEDARIKVQTLIDSGADIIKIAIEDNLQGRTWPMLSMDEIIVIVNTAHENGVPVSAHISRSEHLEMAIEAGVDDVAHMVIDVLPDSLITQMIEHDMYWEPTLELWKGVSEMYSLNWDNIAMNNLGRFVNAGGKVAIGTDFGGYTTEFDSGMPIREIQMMEDAGMSPMQIIIAGTKNAAHVCNIEDKLGTLEIGKLADIIVVEADPLDDIEALVNIQIVIHNGTIIHTLF
ncbi:MAG: amidohydrolase family protein [Candidatus Marinimicrobia bacterium]|nr:amidohydrolase family protein [Candidatus Neomarinimicrobiota bacterium]